MKKENIHKKKGGFKVPEGYFEHFDPDSFTKPLNKKGLWPKDDGHTIPDGYFQAFETNFMKKFHAQKSDTLISLTVRRNIYYTLGAAAAIFILFIGIKNFLPATTHTNQYNISYIDIEAYIDQGYMTLDNDDIAGVFEDMAIDISMITDDLIEDEQLVEYLHQHLEDYNDIMITE